MYFNMYNLNQSTIKLESGNLKLYPGPMWSGKTSKLLSDLTLYADLGLNVLYINHKIDERETESSSATVTTHNSSFKGLSPKIETIKCYRLSGVEVEKYDIIGIDEGQLYDDIFENVIKWVNVLYKYVIVSYLDGDVFRNEFGHCHKLLPHADEYTKLNARCKKCLDDYNIIKNAPFTIRLSDEKDVIVIGGSDKYKPVCRYHYENR